MRLVCNSIAPFRMLSKAFSTTVFKRSVEIPKITRGDLLTEKGLQKLEKAAKIGLCHFKIPDECKSLFKSGVEFANTFYKNEELQKSAFKQYPFEGSVKSEKAQYESVFIPERVWKEYLPSNDCFYLAQSMKRIGIDIIKSTLFINNFPESQWNQVTGGITENRGWLKFAGQHYRKDVNKIGLMKHADSGFITLLGLLKNGLQAYIEGNWVDVKPLDDYLVVNWGLNMENLVNNKEKLRAVLHRVVQQETDDRVSFAFFADPNPDFPIYVRDPNGQGLIKLDENHTQYMARLHKQLYEQGN